VAAHESAYRGWDLAGLGGNLGASSLGCGNPVGLAELRPGQTVLDLGSGAGLDCFLAARQVGSEGHVIGVDKTTEMVRLANKHCEELGASNVEFRGGAMERLPVESESVDVVLSNCAVNLSSDLPAAFRETFRVLKPGGTLAVSDIMLDRPLPQAIRDALSRGATASLSMADLGQYLSAMEEAGFTDVEVTREYIEPGTETVAAVAAEGTGRRGPGPAARMVVQIAETGEILAQLNLDDLARLEDIPRSIRGNITARKPALPRRASDP